jgi:uncharacterized BrkB/YihY/UPF0761 family membrane protein
MRAADGFSHARSLAFAIALVLLEGIIGVVGVASALGERPASDVIARSMRAAVPGPAGQLLTQAVNQAHHSATAQGHLALLVGLIGAIITACTFMGQLERALNRLYGVEQDRPTLHKYGLALALTLSAGVLAIAAFIAIILGTLGGREPRDQASHDRILYSWSTCGEPASMIL